MGTETTMTPEQKEAADKIESAVQARIKELKLVPETDLLAVKSGKEGLERKLKENEEQWKTQSSELQNKQFAAEAKTKELEEKYNSAATSAKELEEVKPKLETAQKRSEEFEKRALEYRRKLVVASYNGVTADAVATKTMEQLDSYEEALKAVSASRGVGNYAVGGAGGGTPTAESPLERARRVITEAEERRGISMKVKSTT
jgi:hypothetical protein